MTPKERLSKVQVALASYYGVKCRLRLSTNSVPHIVGDNWSLVFFGKTRTWVVFYPWPSGHLPQESVKFPVSTNIGEMAEILKKIQA